MDGRYAGDPVVVIGNGPVGQTTALLLARWGIPTVVMDAQAGREPVGSRSICHQRDTLDTWESVGVGRRVAEEGVTFRVARTYFREHELFALTFPDPGESPFPPWVNLSQARVEELLDERIAATPAVDVRWSHEVVGLRDLGDHVEVEALTPDGTVVLTTPYAVGCAGARGEVVRAAAGVGFGGRTFDDHFLICDIRCDLSDRALERRFHFDPEWNPGRQVLMHPCPGSTFRIDWQVPPGFDLDAEERAGALDARIRQVVGDAAYELVWRSVYRFHSRAADRMAVGRVLLAGDCAHLMAPFGARGLNSGVADAENAAWKLAFVLHGWAGPGLVATYDDERRAAAAENLDVTTRTMDFLVPQTEEAWARRRDLLERAVTDPDVLPQVDSGRLAEPFWYVESPLTTPDPTRSPATRPTRGQLPAPGVGVLLPDFPVAGGRRLRELARDGLLLLLADGTDPARVGAEVSAVGSVPVSVCPMADLTPDGTLAAALGARRGDVWVVRPDAHVAAIVPASVTNVVRAAVERVLVAP